MPARHRLDNYHGRLRPSPGSDDRYLTVPDDVYHWKQVRTSDRSQRLSHLGGYHSDNGETGGRDALNQEQHWQREYHHKRERSAPAESDRTRSPTTQRRRGDHAFELPTTTQLRQAEQSLGLTKTYQQLRGEHALEPPRRSAHQRRGEHAFELEQASATVMYPTNRTYRTKPYVPTAKTGFGSLRRSRSTDDLANRLPERILDDFTDKRRSVTGLPFTATVSSPGSSDAEKFAYRELQGTNSFRLVKVLPKKTYKLKCEIIHSTLLQPPEYIAISYAWGDGFDKKDITLDHDENFTVNASLHDALMAIREWDHAILVWIDGLSIDQGNKVECAAQVQLMDQIYAKATSVAIWLGPETDDSAHAIRLLKELQNEKRASEWIKSVGYDGRAALRSLFERDYWKRLWVVQEVYLARKIHVHCGSSKLPWGLHRRASDALWQHESDPYLRTGPSSFPDIERLLALGPDCLLEVLRACRKKLSENPRDKIFGILGILPNDVREHLRIRYDKSVKSLYLDVAQLIIPSTRRLDVIREAIHFPPQASSTNLPTWCPDWAQVPETSALSAKEFSAAGDSYAQCDFKDELRKLEISAIELGVIDMTGVAVGTLCALQDYLMAFLNWRTILLSFFDIDEDTETRYRVVHDFCLTLSLGQLLEGWERYWTDACYQVFSSLIQERLPRLKLDRNFKRHEESGILRQHERRTFIQKHFGDKMVRTVL
jgi:hypothetical protein